MSKEFQLFLKTFPDAGKAYTSLFQSVMERPALDEKTRQLILIGAMTAQNYPPGVRAHVPQAIKAGATREEILDAVLTPLPVSGINGVIECLAAAIFALPKD
ncbi:MAG TPA: carboxymuconolactone decarboxylase family protein [Nitrospirota bacterium]|nr:carboxymuconolactone decarboxylase family protein [Nitrospirota bacterium]